jgi:predicted CXXCH cytochrome family protein
MVIAGLRLGKKYKLRVVSEDLFGNKSQSKILSFSTARKLIKKSGSQNNVNKKVHKKLAIKYGIFKNNDNILLKFKTNKTIFIGVGIKKTQSEHLAGAMKTKGAAPKDHNLKDLVSTTNKVCEQCHGKYVAKKNHPINIPISPGMAMPKDFFVLNNGNITCVTCHAAHASDFEYRLVRSSKRELCISCHLAKI